MYISNCRYCAKCREPIEGLSCAGTLGWCLGCKDTVAVSQCKVRYWVLALTLALFLGVQLLGAICKYA